MDHARIWMKNPLITEKDIYALHTSRYAGIISYGCMPVCIDDDASCVFLIKLMIITTSAYLTSINNTLLATMNVIYKLHT